MIVDAMTMESRTAYHQIIGDFRMHVGCLLNALGMSSLRQGLLWTSKIIPKYETTRLRRIWMYFRCVLFPKQCLQHLGVLTSFTHLGTRPAFSPRRRPSPPCRRLVAARRRRPFAPPPCNRIGPIESVQSNRSNPTDCNPIDCNA